MRDAISAYYTLLGDSEALAYLVNMTPRLLQLHRVLKPNGTLFLHCDPTMSHYLKVLLDALFDAWNFQNEISWKRFSGKNDSKRFGRSHDVILFYSKSKTFKWNVQYERLGYPTQKQKQVADKGMDGVARFPLGKGKIGKMLVSVKGGKTITPSMVRDLAGTVATQSAQMGLLITMSAATRGINDAISRGGVFTHPANGEKFPRLQHITIAELLARKRPQVPPTFLPYIAAQSYTVTLEESTLFSVV